MRDNHGHHASCRVLDWHVSGWLRGSISGWHLATQVLYVVGAVLLLFAEIFARAQLCCDERKSVYWALAIIVLTSGALLNCVYAVVAIYLAQTHYVYMPVYRPTDQIEINIYSRTNRDKQTDQQLTSPGYFV